MNLSEDVFDDLISLHLDKRARAAEPGISCEDDFHEISVFSLAMESAMDYARQGAASASRSTAVDSVQHNGTSSVCQSTAVDSVQHSGTSSVLQSMAVNSDQCASTSSVLKSTVIDCYQYDMCNYLCTETLGDDACQQDEALCNLLMDIDIETCEVT